MPRLRFRATKSPSRLEDRFQMLWKAVDGPPLEREYRFNADLEPSRLAGGEIDSAQRDPKGPRTVRWDAGQKYLEAGLAGWRVFRFGPDQITLENVQRLVALLAEGNASAS